MRKLDIVERTLLNLIGSLFAALSILSLIVGIDFHLGSGNANVLGWTAIPLSLVFGALFARCFKIVLIDMFGE